MSLRDESQVIVKQFETLHVNICSGSIAFCRPYQIDSLIFNLLSTTELYEYGITVTFSNEGCTLADQGKDEAINGTLLRRFIDALFAAIVVLSHQNSTMAAEMMTVTSPQELKPQKRYQKRLWYSKLGYSN